AEFVHEDEYGRRTAHGGRPLSITIREVGASVRRRSGRPRGIAPTCGRPGVYRLQELDDVPHMRREGGEALLDGLLVADVGEDVGEDGQRGAVAGRDEHARLR